MFKMKKGVLQDALYLTAGGAAANKVANMNIPLVPEKVKPFVPAIVGILLMGQKSKTIQMIGMGMVAAGGPKAINTVVPALGIGSEEGLSDYQIEGYQPAYALAGASEPISRSYALAGTDETNTDMFG